LLQLDELCNVPLHIALYCHLAELCATTWQTRVCHLTGVVGYRLV
jgi:hypothetical protein